MSIAYYNDIDPFTCEWTRQLIKAKLIPDGIVDSRSITEVKADDLKGFKQCHFFNGISGWPLALKLAGWDTNEPVWTGSAPCQPFSAAGKGKGQADPRHLWPEWFRLIRECKPGTIFGEQVANAVGHGWIDGVFTDLEAEGYTCGAVVLGAHSVSAPHIRQRLYWVADRNGGREWGQPGEETAEAREGEEEMGQPHRKRPRPVNCRDSGLADARHEQARRPAEPRETTSRRPLSDFTGCNICGAWDDSILVQCADGKARRAKSGLPLLAAGVSGRLAICLPSKQTATAIQEEKVHWYNRTGALRGFGNSIVPPLAALFVAAYMESR